MSATYEGVASATGFSTTGTSLTFAVTIPAGANMIVVGADIAASSGGITVTATCNGVPMQLGLGPVASGGAGQTAGSNTVFYLANPTSGNVVITRSSGSSLLLGNAVFYSDAGTPTDFTSNAQQNVSPYTVSVTAATDGIAGAFYVYGHDGEPQTHNRTERFTLNVNNSTAGGNISYQDMTGTGSSAALTMTTGTPDWYAGIAFVIPKFIDPDPGYGYLIVDGGTGRLIVDGGTGLLLLGTNASPPSGTDYPRGVSETASATDAVARAVALSRSASESSGGSDVVSRASARVRATSESAAASDSCVASVGRVRAVGETAAATDVTNASGTRQRAVSETGGGSDSLARSSTRSRAQSETAAATDGNAWASGKARAQSESAPATDTNTRQSSRARAITETAAATDAAVRTESTSRGLTETAAATDTAARSSARSRSISDSAPAVDSTAASTAGQLARSTSESAPASDTTAKTGTRSRATSETAPASDATARFSSKTRQTTELAAATDLAARSLAAARATLDVALASDTTAAVVVDAPDVTLVTVVVGLRSRSIVGGGLDPREAMSLHSAPTTVRIKTRGVHASLDDRRITT